MLVNVRLRDKETGEFLLRNSVDARELCEQKDGRYERAPDDPPPVEEEEADEPGVQKPEGDALTEAICGAIEDLNEVEDFNANGEPSLWALEHALGYSVTSDERTSAWTDYQLAQKEAEKAAAKAAAKNK